MGGGLEERLRAVLDGPDSPLTALARAVLTGTQAALASGAGAAGPGDPARAACAALADELAALLAGAPAIPSAAHSMAPSIALSVAPAEPHDRGSGPLAELAHAFMADPRVAAYLGRSSVVKHADVDTWRALWTACLRLDPAVADEWRDRARAIRDERLNGAGPATWLELPGAVPRVLVEPAPALATPGIREAPGGPRDPDVAEALGPDGDDGLAVLATQVVRIAQVDPTTCHALEGLRTSGLHPLDDPRTWNAYRTELHRRLGALAGAEPGTPAALRAHRLVDEALCSIVHRPPAHPASWWGGVADRSRRLLEEHVLRARATGVDAEVKVLEIRPYADLQGYTGNRDIAYRAGDPRSGEILACLRTWLRVGEDRLPGRVIYGRE
ncbi:hypothetical protein Ssi03_56070 [Sphaerisporangium siamense]|uniref:Uncharacterized protein n=1 Tax=Sphaerisporangium siamense TaxID=795645 RepID=A0A7W7G9Z9_9ACTN|nr:hypothetical protein [Sphaerisporangium siamense]MBB4703388.1 hypothetical protein [Sphaerisporangium siamense]GII87617.1 hypothetical protein Ssi03_56070 [Sphaerisporangium siamense]